MATLSDNMAKISLGLANGAQVKNEKGESIKTPSKYESQERTSDAVKCYLPRQIHFYWSTATNQVNLTFSGLCWDDWISLMTIAELKL